MGCLMNLCVRSGGQPLESAELLSCEDGESLVPRQLLEGFLWCVTHYSDMLFIYFSILSLLYYINFHWHISSFIYLSCFFRFKRFCLHQVNSKYRLPSLSTGSFILTLDVSLLRVVLLWVLFVVLLEKNEVYLLFEYACFPRVNRGIVGGIFDVF